MNKTRLLYKDANKYLLALANFQEEKDIDKQFQFPRTDAIKGLLIKEGLVNRNASSLRISDMGRTVIEEGGLYRQYILRLCRHIATFVAAISALVTLIIEIIR